MKSPYQMQYEESISNPVVFWEEQASALEWFKFPKSILTTKTGGQEVWFEDGLLNMSYLCIDKHVLAGRGNAQALIFDSPVTQTKKIYTYNQLQEAVAKLAGAMDALGLVKGDRAVIYMPMIPEAVFAMLACARIGVIHSVVFGGFAPHELAIRIDDAKPKAIITASYGMEFDKQIPYKPLVDAAIEQANHHPSHVLLFQREGLKATMQSPIDKDIQSLMDQAKPIAPVWVNASHPLYILYTSGTTGKPKGIVRDTGGYAVALKYSMGMVYHANEGEVFWAASDVGWVVGHSYIVYGPLLQGCTTVLYEGKPIKTPNPGAFWRMIEEYQVKVMFTAPTAIRAIKKEDPDGKYFKQYHFEHFNTLFLAGERCDPATYYWVKELIQKPVIDHWWQTESGWPMLGLMLGLEQVEPIAGSAGKPIVGFDVQILSEEGGHLGANEEGIVAVKLPLPPGCLMTLWQNDQWFIDAYLAQYPGYYLTGDGGKKDANGFYYIMGRIDDVINVSGHRLSTGEMEEIVAQYPAVAECAVVGIADELRGQRPIGFVVLKDGFDLEESALEQALVQLIRDQIGAIAFFKNALLVKRLPKTRSGKILRKTMRMLADGQTFSMPSTIDDPQILTEIEERLRERKLGNAFQ